MIRVSVEAPSAIVRAGIEALLAPYPEIRLAADSPDVLILQPDEEPEVVAPSAAVLLIDQPSAAWLAQILRTGGRAVLPTDSTGDELRAAIHAAAAGLIALHPRDAAAFAAPVNESRPARPLEPLTPRETEILALVADGLSNKEIASRLQISDHTVKFHLASILGKLGASTRAEAVSIGLRHGLILL